LRPIINQQSALENEKGHRHILAMPSGFAGDPAPQQLTAPCRKYSGRLHPPLEQVMYRSIFLRFARVAETRREGPNTKLVGRLHF
jgi:hypothetical protein